MRTRPLRTAAKASMLLAAAMGLPLETAWATTIVGTQVNVVTEGQAPVQDDCALAAAGYCESWADLIGTPHRAYGQSRSDSARVADISVDTRGTGTAVAVASWNEVLVNNGNQAQEVWLDFSLMNGWISADAGRNGGTGLGYFTVSMLVNGNPVYQLEVSYDSTATPGGDTDQLTGFVQKPARVEWEMTVIDNVFMGTIQPLGVLEVMYTMAAGATSHDDGVNGFTIDDPDNSAYCIGADGIEILPGDANVECASAHVNIGDPGEFRFSFTPVGAVGTNVPVPGSLPLTALGLLGMARWRRRALTPA